MYLLLSTVLLAAAHIVAAQIGVRTSDTPDISVARGYIIEYASDAAKAKRDLASVSGITVVKTFESDIFNGASILTDVHDIDTLTQLSSVANVWHNRLYSLERAISPRSNSTNETMPGPLTSYNAEPHIATHVDKLHAKGIYGKGVKIGVIDTGVDYTHPALGGGFGPGYKIVGGTDLVGDGNWPQVGNSVEPDDDPMDNLGHGTHVSGIILGEADGYIGVAPEATIYMYKGRTSTDVVIDGFLLAYNEGVDVITSSIGGPAGWSDDPWAVVASRIAEQGIIVCISAANYGSMGPFYASTGSSGTHVLAVGAADTTNISAVGLRSGDYAGWGLLSDLTIKPDVAAPGTLINSTYLDHSWYELTGTSMSSPYLASVAALYIGEFGGRDVHGKDFAIDLGKKIISSSQEMLSDDVSYSELPASVAQVGGGMVDAFKLFYSNISVDYTPFALNDSAHFNSSHEITVTNTGSQTATYHVSVRDSLGVETLDVDEDGAQYVRTLAELVPQKYVPKISFPDDFTLEPEESKTVTIQFESPDSLGWDLSQLPLYSGRIIILSGTGENVSIPYAGLAGDLKGQLGNVFITDMPYLASGEDYINRDNNTAFTFNLTLDVQDFPRVIYGCIWGADEIRWDIFEEGWTEQNWTWPLVVGKDGYVGSATSWVGSGESPVFNPSWDVDDVDAYPLRASARTTYAESWWFGKLANGTQIANGSYVMRYAHLRPFGSEANSEDWSSWSIPIDVLGQY